MSEAGSQPSTSSDNSDSLTYINRNGGIVLLRAGHQYTKKKQYKTGWSLWRCVNWRKNCSGSLNVKGNKITKENHHQCEPNEVDNIVAQKLHDCREKVLSSSLSPILNIYNDFKAEFNDASLDIIKKLPSFTNIKTALYDARNKQAGILKYSAKMLKK